MASIRLPTVVEEIAVGDRQGLLVGRLALDLLDLHDGNGNRAVGTVSALEGPGHSLDHELPGVSATPVTEHLSGRGWSVGARGPGQGDQVPEHLALQTDERSRRQEQRDARARSHCQRDRDGQVAPDGAHERSGPFHSKGGEPALAERGQTRQARERAPRLIGERRLSVGVDDQHGHRKPGAEQRRRGRDRRHVDPLRRDAGRGHEQIHQPVGRQRLAQDRSVVGTAGRLDHLRRSHDLDGVPDPPLPAGADHAETGSPSRALLAHRRAFHTFPPTRSLCRPPEAERIGT